RRGGPEADPGALGSGRAVADRAGRGRHRPGRLRGRRVPGDQAGGGVAAGPGLPQGRGEGPGPHQHRPGPAAADRRPGRRAPRDAVDNYRIMAQQFWRADMDGQDWHAMTSWYDPVIDRVVTDDDFQDMMWEVMGELGTSYAYVSGAPYQADPPMKPGYLGADLEQREGRWVITRILPGDSSDPAAHSPLLAPGVAAEIGDAIVRIDGREVGDEGVDPLLIGSADRPTELVLERDGSQRRVAVTPVASDEQLRYQAWVTSRRERVSELSGDRLGYLHIPDMVSSGW